MSLQLAEITCEKTKLFFSERRLVHCASSCEVKQRSIQLRLHITAGCVFMMQILLSAFMCNCTALRHQSV